jgi:tripartite-type tricarboxylate transporter receptor subunit TctC
MIVPYPAGGLFDVVARAIAEPMRVSLGQSVVVENVGGANGSIATARLVRAAPDGYTIGIGSGDQFVINAVLYPLQYDLVKDFEPVGLIMDGPTIIVGRNGVPAPDLKSLVPWLKANAATVTHAHNGGGGAVHLCGIELQRITGATWPFIPYRGAAPALQDVVGGRIDVMCASPASALPMARNGLIRAYAITAGKRLIGAPEVPTTDEQGFPGFHFAVWGGMFAPKGTPKDAIARLNRSLTDALADPAAQRRLVDLGQEIFAREKQTPEALAALQRTEIEKWWPIIRAANIKPE